MNDSAEFDYLSTTRYDRTSMTAALLEQLALSAEKFPHQPVIDSFGLPITTQQLNSEADVIAAALHATGFAPGDVAGIYLPSCAQRIVAALGILRAGGRILFCPPVWRADEVMAQMELHSAETLFTLSKLYPAVSTHVLTPQRLIVTQINAYFPRWKQFQFKHVFEKKNGHRIELKADAMAYADFLKLGKKSPAVFANGAVDGVVSAENYLTDFAYAFNKGQLFQIKTDSLFM